MSVRGHPRLGYGSDQAGSFGGNTKSLQIRIQGGGGFDRDLLLVYIDTNP